MNEGDVAAFVETIAAALDLHAIRRDLRAIPDARWPAVRDALRVRLGQEGPGEAGRAPLRQGLPLAERFRTLSALLLRQVRLEKRDLVEAEDARRTIRPD
ncbi:MAG: hypothetical protein FJ033_07455 [Chloroflexi bacterium]|nr:hypothetical protein [Chloroflexota bacterium]